MISSHDLGEAGRLFSPVGSGPLPNFIREIESRERGKSFNCTEDNRTKILTYLGLFERTKLCVSSHSEIQSQILSARNESKAEGE